MNIIERIDRPCEYVEVAQTALIACRFENKPRCMGNCFCQFGL